MQRIAFFLTPLIFLLASAASDPTAAQVRDERQKEARATVEGYARDMMIVLPCFYMTAPPTMWDKGFGAPELSETLAGYASRGASRAQVDELRKAFEEAYQPQFVGDVRVMAKACNDGKIFDAIYKIMGPATPLMLRPPFRNKP